MSIKMNKIKSLLIVGVACFGLAACDLSSPSRLTVKEIELEDQYETLELNTHQVDKARMNNIIKEYKLNGNGEIRIVSSYDNTKRSGSLKAIDTAAMYKKYLADNDIRNVDVKIIPHNNSLKKNKLFVTYNRLKALPPEGCHEMPGYSNGSTNLKVADEYGFKCQTKTLLSKMVVDPNDLMGVAGNSDGDSKRLGVIVDANQTGVIKEPIGGLSSTDVTLNE